MCPLETGNIQEQSIIPAELLNGKKEQSLTLENDSWKTSNKKAGWLADSPCDGNFPKVGQVIPEALDDDLTIALDAELLFNLAKALSNGNHYVVLRIQAPNKPVLVTAEDNLNAIGVIMPREAPLCSTHSKAYNALRDSYQAAEA